jgi:predicted dehydrogenase
VLRARAELAELGPIQALRSTISDSALDQPDIPAWKLDRSRGGGALLEKLVHHVDLWRHLSGDEVEQVFAATRSNRSDDSIVTVTAALRGGAVANALGMDETATENELVIYGQEGSITLGLYRSDGYRRTALHQVPGATRQRLETGVRGAAELAGGFSKERRAGDFKGSYVTHWRRLLRAIETGQEPDCTLEDGRASLEVVLAAVQSADQRSPVAIGAVPA